MLTFDEQTHSYYWHGENVPGVTSILNEWQKISVGVAGSRFHVNRYTGTVLASDVMEEAAAKGHDIHKGSQIILSQGGVDWDSLAPEYVGPLRQFEQWLSDVQPNVLYTELPVYSDRYRYAGTIDIVAHIGRALCIIDIKTGESNTVGAQLAAYEKAFCEHNRYTGRTERWVLWLPKNGSPYKFERCSNQADFDFFKSCLLQRSYLKGV